MLKQITNVTIIALRETLGWIFKLSWVCYYNNMVEYNSPNFGNKTSCTNNNKGCFYLNGSYKLSSIEDGEKRRV